MVDYAKILLTIIFLIQIQNLVSLEFGNREIYKKEKHVPSNDIKLNFQKFVKNIKLALGFELWRLTIKFLCIVK